MSSRPSACPPKIRARRAVALGCALLSAMASSALAGSSAQAKASVPMTVGIDAHPGFTSVDTALMATSGIRAVRFQINWALAEPARGTFSWRAYDSVFTTLARGGLTATPFLISKPAWVDGGDPRFPTTDDGLRDWQQFVAAVVARYGAGGSFWKANPGLPYRPVRMWELWNEPNLRAGGAAPVSVDDYVALLRYGAAAVRSTDPSAYVMAASLGVGSSNGSTRSAKFLREMYRAGAGHLFDVVGDHPYAHSVAGSEREVKRVRRVMDRHGDAAKPLWITEVGWASETAANRLMVGLDAQKSNTAGFLSWLRANAGELGVGGLEWFNWSDPAPGANLGGCAPCGSLGLLSSGLVPKPAWLSFLSFALHPPALG